MTEDVNGDRETPENGRRTYRSCMVDRRVVHVQGACSMTYTTKRDKSNQIEEDAIKLLEGRLKEIAERY